MVARYDHKHGKMKRDLRFSEIFLLVCLCTHNLHSYVLTSDYVIAVYVIKDVRKIFEGEVLVCRRVNVVYEANK